MKTKTAVLLLTVLFAFGFVTPSAKAVSIYPIPVVFASGDRINEYNGVTGTNVLITPHPVWALPPIGKWISFENTGYGGIVIPNAPLSGPPSARFFEDFYLPGNVNTGSIMIGADDTASVWITNALFPGGHMLFMANPVQDANCAAGPIGCTAGEFGVLPLTGFLSQGKNTLEIDAWQRGGATFGITYSGNISSDYRTPIPEPATISMIGIGLLAFAGIAQRQQQRQKQ